MGSASLWVRVEDTPRESIGRVDTGRDASLWLRQSLAGHSDRLPMTDLEKIRAILTDTHFLIPLIVFCIGLALLITLH
jgi:hypothetical protein